jgi:hypothetical protein
MPIMLLGVTADKGELAVTAIESYPRIAGRAQRRAHLRVLRDGAFRSLSRCLAGVAATSTGRG